MRFFSMSSEEKFRRAQADRKDRRVRLDKEHPELVGLPLGERMKRASQMMTQDFKDALGEILEKRKLDRF
jgi:hypothetical protein